MWILLCFTPLLLFLPYLGKYVYLPGAEYSDLVISHLPNAFFLKSSILSGQGIPLWSPTIMSGYPFVADPLSGLHYPPGWLALFFPLPMGFNLMVVLHLVFGACGLYFWLKEEGVAPPVAALTGMAFGCLLKIIGHYAAGHLTLVYAVVWTPWLLWAEKRWFSSPRPFSLWRAPGVVLGIITLADPRWVIYGGLLWLAYASMLRYSSGFRLNQIMRSLIYFLSQVFLMLAVAAVLLLPFCELILHSTRSLMTPQDTLTLSLPFSGILNLFFPISGGRVEWLFYPGAVILALIIVGASSPLLRRRVLFWLVIAAISLLFSFGSNLPGMDLLASVPGFNLIRVPSRILFVTAFSLTVAGGYVLSAIISQQYKKGSIKILPLVIVTVASLVFTTESSFLSGRIVTELILGSIALLIAAILIGLYKFRRLSTRNLLFSFFALMLINLFWMNWHYMEMRSPDEIMSDQSDVAAYLSKQTGLFRVYSPSYSIPQQVAVKYGLQLADGVDPLQLINYWSYMLNASGVPAGNYSVTLPNYATGNPVIDNRDYIPDSHALGRLNVRYVVSSFEIDAGGLELVEQFEETYIYMNQYYLSRAWVEANGEENKPVEILEYSFNRISLKAIGPGDLVLSEISYPGWRVEVDGQLEKIKTQDNLLRSVELKGGSHLVTFSFHPVSAYIGATISLTTILVLIGVACWGKSHKA